MNKLQVIIRFISAFAFAAASLAGFWLFGFEFNERGNDALQCYLVMLIHFVIGFVLPRFKGDN